MPSGGNDGLRRLCSPDETESLPKVSRTRLDCGIDDHVLRVNDHPTKKDSASFSIFGAHLSMAFKERHYLG